MRVGLHVGLNEGKAASAVNEGGATCSRDGGATEDGIY